MCSFMKKFVLNNFETTEIFSLFVLISRFKINTGILNKLPKKVCNIFFFYLFYFFFVKTIFILFFVVFCKRE